MSVSALQTAIWSLKVTNIIAPGKTVEDGEIFVAHVARCGKRRHKIDRNRRRRWHYAACFTRSGHLMHITPRSADDSRGAKNVSSASRT